MNVGLVTARERELGETVRNLLQVCVRTICVGNMVSATEYFPESSIRSVILCLMILVLFTCDGGHLVCPI